MSKQQTRRQFIRNAGYVALGVTLLGCGSSSGSGSGSGRDDDIGSGAISESEAPIWSRIPVQSWIVGVPVHIDLADYVVDPDDDNLIFLLDRALPDGVSLNGGVISGTPVATLGQTTFVATADDNN